MLLQSLPARLAARWLVPVCVQHCRGLGRLRPRPPATSIMLNTQILMYARIALHGAVKLLTTWSCLAGFFCLCHAAKQSVASQVPRNCIRSQGHARMQEQCSQCCRHITPGHCHGSVLAALLKQGAPCKGVFCDACQHVNGCGRWPLPMLRWWISVATSLHVNGSVKPENESRHAHRLCYTVSSACHACALLQPRDNPGGETVLSLSHLRQSL